MASLFSRIIAREIPAWIVAEDEEHLAFLDVFPLVKGHTLVIPKREVDYIFDLEQEAYGRLFAFARRVSSALKQSVECKRIGIAVIGLEVPHAHIHLVPLMEAGDLNFSRAKLALTEAEFKALRNCISANFS